MKLLPHPQPLSTWRGEQLIGPKYFPILLLLLFSINAFADGGMYPINTISKANLKKAGLKMDVKDIYNPNGQGLIKAVVQLGGCTGSFVSDKGLIITNHHCSFGSLEQYSTLENNLLEKGFLAGSQEKELPFKGMTCRILQSHQDVSEDILKGTEKVTDGVEKKNIIAKNIAAYKQAEALKFPDLMLEISEMLPGKSYMLFRYFLIKDIRIVYIPARNIGEFGGESDNWEWPRHTGDFSFVRAYVSRDGKGTEYSADNVPYHPQEFLNINAKGLSDNDFVFILGYPGRTFRNQPAEFLNYQEHYTMPYISDLYSWEINTIKSIGTKDEKFMLRNEPKIKSLANTEKNYKGKIKTMRKIELYKARKDEETQILVKLKCSDRRKLEKNLASTDSLYNAMEKIIGKYLWYTNLFAESKTMAMAEGIYNFNNGLKNKKPEELAKAKAALIINLRNNYKSIYLTYDITFLKKMLGDGVRMKDDNYSAALREILFKDVSYSIAPQAWENIANIKVQKFTNESFRKNELLDSTNIFKLINAKPDKLQKLKDPFLNLVRSIYPDYHKTDSLMILYKAQLDALLPEYVDLRMEAMGQDFMPDANRTLRLTYGYIRGYSPSDATYCSPFTTVNGMVEKDGAAPDYRLNSDLARLLREHTYGNYKLKDKDDLPMCMLYNTYTTGGNSGSPVLDANGQLVGVNFDRCLEATVNDFAWNESYSRSICVDIRFVLWTTSKVAGADYLLKEMSIIQ